MRIWTIHVVTYLAGRVNHQNSVAHVRRLWGAHTNNYKVVEVQWLYFMINESHKKDGNKERVAIPPNKWNQLDKRNNDMVIISRGLRIRQQFTYMKY